MVAVTAAVAPTTMAAVIVESAAEGVGVAVPPLLVVAAEVVVAGLEGRRRGAGELPILAVVAAAAEVAARGEAVAGRVQFPDRCVCFFFFAWGGRGGWAVLVLCFTLLGGTRYAWRPKSQVSRPKM